MLLSRQKKRRTFVATSNTVLAETHATQFCLSLVRAGARLSRRLDSALVSYHGINFTEYQLLLELLRAPDGRLRPSQLAPRLELTASGVSRTLHSLEKTGLVTRQNDPRDARVAYAHITSNGANLVENAAVVIDDVINAYLCAHQIDMQPTRPSDDATYARSATVAAPGPRRE